MGQSDRIKARARLALRAEKAFGLDAIQIRPAMKVGDAKTQAAGGIVETPEINRVMPTPAQARVDLFGKPAIEQTTQQRGLVPPPTVAPITAPSLAREEKILRLNQLDQNEVKGCTRC